MKRTPLLLVLLVCLLPVILITVIVALLEYSIPNTLASPLLGRLPLFPDMLAGNFFQGMQLLLFDFHLLAITSVHQAEVLWGVYWGLIDIVLLVVTALLLAKLLPRWKCFAPKQKWLIIGATVLSWSALFDLWLSGCCTAGPAWWLEVLFLFKAYASNPYLDSINWQGIYQFIASISLVLRMLLYVAGMTLLWRSSRVALKR